MLDDISDVDASAALRAGVDNDPVYLASQLVRMSLTQTRAQDQNYQSLLRMWQSNQGGFRQNAIAIALGLGLRIVDVDNRFGVVVVPTSRHSPFATRIKDIRRKSDDMTASLLGITMIAVAASFYPTSDKLAEHGRALSQRTGDILRTLNTLVAQWSAGTHGTESPPEPVWAQLEALPEKVDGERRASLKSREGLVTITLQHMAEENLLRAEHDSSGILYNATNRWRLQVADAAGHDLYRLCQRLLQNEKDA